MSHKQNAAGFLRQKDLIPNRLPFSHATLWRLVAAGDFPQPVKLSPRVTAWRAADVASWEASRKA